MEENTMISVVGNANSLFDKQYGKLIDKADTVIRFNNAFPKVPECQGVKTTKVITYSDGKWNKIKHLWPDDTPYEIMDPYSLRTKYGCHLSTLMMYLFSIDGTPDISIFGVDHNKTWSYYQDHKGYTHNWEREKKFLEELCKKK